MRIAIRYTVALLLGLACAYVYFMHRLPYWPQWMPLTLFLALISAVLVLPSRMLGRLSPRVLLVYCAPVTLITLLLSWENWFTPATAEPIAGVLIGALAAWGLTEALDRIANRIKHRGDEAI
jgi:ABC-type iron transport system FetAB permease component